MRRSASLLPVYREESEAEGGEVNEPNMQPDPATSTFKLLLFSHAKKESFMLPRSTHHPNFIYLVHQQQTLQCHQILLIFSESYGLKGWVKCFPKSSECTKKGGKKIRSATYKFQVRDRANASIRAEKGWSTILLRTGWSTTLLTESLVMIFSLTISKRNGR